MTNALAINRDFNKFIWSITFILLLFSTLIFNPFYILILCVLIEQFKHQPKIFYWAITTSIVMSIVNREIGGSWGNLDTGFANDDALIYLDAYFALETDSYLANPSEYLYKFFNGQEPGWYVLMELIGMLTNYNQDMMLFFSVALPIFVIHFAVYRSFRYPLFALLVFYFISTEVIHTFYHLWRFSLAMSLAILVIMLWKTNKSLIKKGAYYILPAIGHITILAPMFLLFVSNFFRSKRQHKVFGLVQKLKLSGALIFSIMSLALFLYVLLINFEYSKIVYYFASNSEASGGLNLRFILQLSICFFLMAYSKKPLVFVFSFFAAFVLSLPLVIDLSFIFIRLSVIFTPLVSLFYCLEVENKKPLVYLTIIIGSILFLRLALNSSDIGHYQYMAQGDFFSIHAGLIYNLFGETNVK